MRAAVAWVAAAVVAVSSNAVAAAGSSGTGSPGERVDSLFAAYAWPGSPGVAVGIYRHGEPILLRGYGDADLEQGTRITPQTVFHVASLSKQFTGLAIALLVREGKVRLGADVRDYLPEVPDFGSRITVADLVHHTSGLRDQWSLFALAGHEALPRQRQVLNMVQRQRALDFEPGSGFEYCNTGYTLLAEIVLRVSGKSLRAFTDERMFRPLGMSHTFFYDDVTGIVPGRAQSYEPGDVQGIWKRTLLTYETVGATSLHTTVEDLMKWAANFASPRVGDAALLESLSAPTSLANGHPNAYGFGLYRHEYAGHQAITHTGSDAGFRAVFAYFPREDFAVALLSNASLSLQPWVESLTSLYLDGRPSPPASRMPREIRPTAAQLRALAGDYLPTADKRVTLAVVDGKLTWNTVGGAPWPLVFRANGTADPGDYLYDYYRFTRDASGRVTGFDSIEASGATPPKHYEKIAPFEASGANLQELTGTYRLVELDTTYRFSVEDGKLLARTIWSVEPIVLTPVAPDRFDSPHWALGTFTVRRDPAGRPTGFWIDAGRARHVLLERTTDP